MREKPSIRHPLNIREEELKNRMAAMFFGKYDCTRIVGNIDFCVSPKRRDPRQMTFIPDTPILWAEAKNHPTDIYRMLAQLILTIKGELKGDIEPPRFLGCFDSEKIAFVEYHYVLPVFNLNDFNWTQTPSAVDEKTVATVRGVIPQDKIVVFRFGADDAEIKAFIARNFASGDSPALATPIDRNNFTFIYQKWRSEVMPHIDAPWDILKKKYALYDRDQFLFPSDGWKNDAEFQDDCLVFTLFHGQNRIMSRDGVNHWIPFTEEEVGAKDCFKSHFMSDFINGRASSPHVADIRRVEDNAPYQGELNLSSTGAVAQGEGKEECQPSRFWSACGASEQNRSGGILLHATQALSPAARAVLDAGRELWRYYHAQPDANPNASFYDIKFHFQGSTVDVRGKAKMNSESSDGKYTELLANLKAAMKNLAARIEPKVYEYGFLKW